jgi:hypothetical protein
MQYFVFHAFSLKIKSLVIPHSPHNNDVKSTENLMKASRHVDNNNFVKSIENLMEVSRHIDKVLNVKTIEEVQKNQLRLMTTIESFRWLNLQAYAFKGHDESSASNNQGNFMEMIRLIGRFNINNNDVVLEKSFEKCKVYLINYSKRDFAYSREQIEEKDL